MVIGAVLASVTLALNAGLPIIENLRDTAAIESSIATLQELDGTVRQVASGGKFTTRSFTIRNDRGQFKFDEEENRIYYEIKSNSEIISTHSSRQIGPVTLSANQDVSVQKTEINGTDCWMMENDHLKACIRDVAENWNATDYPSLVGYWRMNEGEGQWANDTSTSNNHGTLGNNTTVEGADPTWIDGIEGNALEFDGNDDYVEIPDFSDDAKNGFTVAARVNPEAVAVGDQQKIVESGDAPTFHEVGGTWKITIYNGSTWHSARTSAEANQWTHVTASWNTTHLRIYVDGKLQGANKTVGTLTRRGGEAAAIGNDGGSDNPTDRNFNGTIDEVRIYDRALHPRDVRWLYQQEGNLDFINNSELLLQYRNKDLEETVTPDMSVRVNGVDETVAGDGYTEPEATGSSVARGRVTAAIQSEHGFTYDLHYDLLSGSDFLKIEVE
jgi:hypothetical protein